MFSVWRCKLVLLVLIFGQKRRSEILEFLLQIWSLIEQKPAEWELRFLEP